MISRRETGIARICFTIIILLAIALVPLIGVGDLQAQESGILQESPMNSAVVVDYSFEKPGIEKGFQDYRLIAIPGLDYYDLPGKPIVPFHTARILIPWGQEVEDVEVIPGEKVYLGEFYIQPGQEPVHLGDGRKVVLTPPDERVYGSDEPYPNELFSKATSQWKRGYQILVLNLYPVEYLPKSRRVSYFRSFKVIITTKEVETGGDALFLGSLQDGELIASTVDNPGEVMTYDSKLRESSTPLQSYDYLIITNEALKDVSAPDNFQALQTWKNSRGVATQIFTVEWIYANYPGADNQESIRNFIKHEYQNSGIIYVLLGGDADGADVGGESGDNIVPVRGLWAWNYETAPPDIPSDLYYACLDGDYDYDGDGIYGEPTDGPDGGEVDLMAEIYVGRAPIDSAAELRNFVSKTIAYESASTDPYLGNVQMVGEELWHPPDYPQTWGGDYKEEAKDGSSHYGYTTVGFPDCYDRNTLYDRDYPGNDWPVSQIVDIIDSNVHIINHMGHGNPCGMMKMTNSNVDGLTNDKYFFGYSMACYSGSFDNRYFHDDPQYLSFDCIVEHFVTEPHGALGFIANSRYGWGQAGSTNGASQRYDREFWDAVFGEHIANVGAANQDSKEDNIGYVAGSGVMRFCYYQINLLGDPETPLWPCPGEPDIRVEPPDFEEWQASNTIEEYTLTIYNDGDADLTYDISDTEGMDCPWLDENPKSGPPVSPGGQVDITVTMDTTGLTAGTNYSAEIVISNNDPGDNPVMVPVTLYVGTALDTDFLADSGIAGYPTEGYAGVTAFNFTDETMGGVPPYSYEWDFDNDTVIDSTLQNPAYIYPDSGNYTVVLTVTDSDSPPDSDTETKAEYIAVREPGDADGDEVVDMGDAIKVERIILGLDPPTLWADANQDGVIDMGDVVKIERIILGLD